ncbi:MAG: hypothetical protein Fur005_23060 [Roseiflexaceae bacterium]
MTIGYHIDLSPSCVFTVEIEPREAREARSIAAVRYGVRMEMYRSIGMLIGVMTNPSTRGWMSSWVVLW